MTLTATTLALGPGLTASFLGVGGTEPYLYSILTPGAGGTIDPDTGAYTAPSVLPDQGIGTDVVQVEDSLGALATLKMRVGSALFLFCNVIQHEMGLASDQVYIWDQKLNIPKDERLYVAVGVASLKPFGVTNRFNTSGSPVSDQSVNMMAKLDVNILSRGPAARERREEVLLALTSLYAEQQMSTNSFLIARLSSGFNNLSDIDGDAIPYRFVISVNMQYFFKKRQAAPYFDDIPAAVIEQIES